MAEVPLYIVDASAVLKLYFQEEPGSQQALELITDYVTGRVNLTAPHLLPYEVSSVLRTRVLQRRLQLPAARRVLSDFLALRIPVDYPDGLSSTGFEYSFRFGLSSYDALYVALAQIRGCRLLTGDGGIVAALGTHLPLAFQIGDYQHPN